MNGSSPLNDSYILGHIDDLNSLLVPDSAISQDYTIDIDQFGLFDQIEHDRGHSESKYKGSYTVKNGQQSASAATFMAPPRNH
jgi:hypothetical protein